MQITSADTSCTAVRASTTPVSGTVFQFTPSSASQPPAQTQNGSNYVQFNNLVTGSYTLSPQAPINNLIKAACWTNLPSGMNGTGLTDTLVGNDTITWDLGYTNGTAWVQAAGGDVYAPGSVASLVPQGISPRYFVLDGSSGGYPGVVTYGTSYNFGIENPGPNQGGSLVSSKGWLVNESYPSTDWYATFYQKFGSPTVPDYDHPGSPVPQPASRPTPYYVTGDMTTQGNWAVGDGQTIIFIVNGNLNIMGTMNITGKGFLAFIVSGNITIDPGVGSQFNNSTVPDIEGVYITSPTGTFETGLSTTGAHARLVLKGIFIGGNFLLQRDLDFINKNTSYSSELFIYNPLLLITMPDRMKESKITWQEVAP